MRSFDDRAAPKRRVQNRSQTRESLKRRQIGRIEVGQNASPHIDRGRKALCSEPESIRVPGAFIFVIRAAHFHLYRGSGKFSAFYRRLFWNPVFSPPNRQIIEGRVVFG